MWHSAKIIIKARLQQFGQVYTIKDNHDQNLQVKGKQTKEKWMNCLHENIMKCNGMKNQDYGKIYNRNKTRN